LEAVEDLGIREAAALKLEMPSLDEGFGQLRQVSQDLIDEASGFHRFEPAASGKVAYEFFQIVQTGIIHGSSTLNGDLIGLFARNWAK
jgi:hypothetical protein